MTALRIGFASASLGFWAGPRGAEGDPPTPPEGKMYTQDQINTMIQDRVNKLNEKNRTLLEQLEAKETSFQGTAAEKEALAAELEEFRQRTLSQSEIEKREAEKARKKYETDLKTAQETGSQWESRFRGLQFNTEVQAAAMKHGVMPTSVPLLAAYLKNSANVLVDDDGIRTEVDFDDTGADGKPFTAKLTVDDAVKRMKELPEQWGNLFTAHLKAGLGGSAGAGKQHDATTPQALAALPMDDFLARRKKGK